jgi:hypothetical protein
MDTKVIRVSQIHALDAAQCTVMHRGRNQVVG